MINSLPSFVRSQLKVKGRTEHNGRGVYDMSFDVSYEELKKRFEDKICFWQAKGLVESMEHKDAPLAEDTIIVFKRGVVKDQFYRGVRVGNHKEFGPVLQVVFVY